MAGKRDTVRQEKTPVSVRAKGKQLVIVESPAKARTLNKYLGPDFVVMASVGHVRDLPDKNPKGVKDPVPGVDLKNGFSPTYQVIKGKTKTVGELKKAARDAAGIWLATDLDREGEAIAWHLTEALGIDLEGAKRVVFNAITKSEIDRAFQRPRKINMDKVNAQQARRILDRIVGYQVSPLLWKKVAGGLSAGRVQSVAVRIIVEREREIEAFIPEEYWKVSGCFTTECETASLLRHEWAAWLAEVPEKYNGRKVSGRTAPEKNRWLADHESFSAELTEVDGKKFEPKSMAEALAASERAGFQILETLDGGNNRAKGAARQVIRLAGRISGGPPWSVKSTQTKRTKSHPFAPFITSTLQQAAANQLDFTAHHTMRIAQALYEGMPVKGLGAVGLITYMRTDSTHVSPEALGMARDYVLGQFGQKYLPEKANIFSSSNKAAQEAHEAIRPTDVALTPESLRTSLPESHYRLYRLIWERFVASQMSDAQWDATTVLISGKDAAGELIFRATGRVLVFDGHYRVSGVPAASEEAILPSINVGEPLAALHLDPTQNFTLPPPRYTEASLVKKLEAEGIGRPSTYAQIIQVIQQRKYVQKTRNRFHATDLGKIVTDKLVEAFSGIMEVGYTRDMEQLLDDIEEKHADWVEMLRRFYGPFRQNLDAAYEGMVHAKAETAPAPHTCPKCGSSTVYRFGRKGRFLSCGQYPQCKFAAPIDAEGQPVEPSETDIACPACHAPMLVRRGRFGDFLSCRRYPECGGILNLDKKGYISPPKTPPLLTDLPCPKCGSPLNLRRGGKGPWLSCSTFPKCRGRLGWTTLQEGVKQKWNQALSAHEKAHPEPIILKLDGTPVGERYRPQIKGLNGEEADTDSSPSPGAQQ
ncbi:MAG: type I DNA topoisomerase [Deltaproteobacteria bacterium]|nr:type I DNA topoisomerase [Deltaproteobacteria bacterium]